MTQFRQITREYGPPAPGAVFLLDVGTYSLKAGFHSDPAPRVEMLSVVGRNRAKSGELKLGADISDQEYTKQSVVSPFTSGILLRVETLQSLLEFVFSTIFRHNESKVFPHPVLCTVPYANPRTAQEYLEDLLRNCFNVQQLGFTVAETQCVQQDENCIVAHLGHTFTTVLCQKSGALSGKRLPFGQALAVEFMLKALHARYGDMAKNVGLDQAIELYRTHGGYGRIYKENQTEDTFQELYAQLCESFKERVKSYTRGENPFRPEQIEYTQHQNNQMFHYLEGHCAFFDTEVPFRSLFDQQRMIQRKEFAEKARASTIQKLILLSQLSEEESKAIALLHDEAAQLDHILQLCQEKLKTARKQYNKLIANNIEATFDELMAAFDVKTEHVIDIPRLRQHQIEIIDRLALCVDQCLFKLKDAGAVPQQFQPMSLLPMQVAYEGFFVSDEGNVLVPIFLEPVVAAELVFQPHLCGAPSQSLDEICKELSKQHNVKRIVLTGGGAKLAGVQQRLAEEVGKVGCSVEVCADEWKGLCRKALSASFL